MTRILIFILSILFSIQLIAQDPTLILGYNFDNGTTTDASIFSNNGINFNAIPASDLEGNKNDALLFNGVNSYVLGGSNSHLVVTDAITIQAKIQALGPGTPVRGGIILNKEGEYSLARFADGSLRYALAFSNDWGVHVNTNYYIPLNEPTHVALTYDRNQGEINVYVNCALVHTANETRQFDDSESGMDQLRVGGRQIFDQFFYGIIDDVKVYNTALDPTDFNCLLSKVELPGLQDEFNIYPNPTNDILYLDNSVQETYNVILHNITGQQIRSIIAQPGRTDISIGDLPAGAYFTKIYDLDGAFLDTRMVMKVQF